MLSSVPLGLNSPISEQVNLLPAAITPAIKYALILKAQVSPKDRPTTQLEVYG
jgi:hypothetical protein